MNSIVTLKELHRILPKISQRLDRSDFMALCRKVSGLSMQIAQRRSSESIDSDLDHTIQRLESRIPGLVTHVRGVANSAEDTTNCISQDVARRIASEIQEDVRHQIALLHQQEQEDKNAWLGLPELWVFDNLPSRMRERATRIRDWCEDRLEFIHSRGGMRYYTAHGIGHSKHVLRFGVDLLRAFQQFFYEPYNFFAMYVGAYCHDIGMMFRENEDPENDSTLNEIRKTHGQRAWELIMGNREHGIPPEWRAMGFSSEREAMLIANLCAVHQMRAEGDLCRLPKLQSLLVDGDTKQVCLFALAVMLRLADALDCNEKRIPPLAYLKHRCIPRDHLSHYLKHELVEDVHVAKDATIHIAMRVRYAYPDYVATETSVRNELASEITGMSGFLSKCGLTLPDPKFNTVEALFLENHPYLVGDNLDGASDT